MRVIILACIGQLFLLSIGNAATPRQSVVLISTKLSRTIRHLYQGSFYQAINGFKEMLEISRESQNKSYEGRCLLWLGITSWDIGNTQDSYGYFDEASRIFIQQGDRISHEFCLNCRRIVELYLSSKASASSGLYNSSIDDIEQGLRLGRELGLPDFELKLLRQKSSFHWDLGDLNLFLESSQRGLDIAERTNNPSEKAKYLNNIGVFYQRNHEYSQALRSFETALSHISHDDRSTRAECINNLALLYRELGYLDKALEYLSVALSLDKLRADEIAILTDLENTGATYLQRGLENKNTQDLMHALSVFMECSVALKHKKYNPIMSLAIYNNIGIIKSELGDYISARRFYSKAMQLVSIEKYALEECYIQNNIASSYFLEYNIELAMKHYKKAYSLGLRNGDDTVVLESCLGIGQCYEAIKRPQDALLYYLRSARIIEELMGSISSEYFRAGFTTKRINAYRRIIRILSDEYFHNPSLNLLDEIHNFIERLKARAFYEGISEAQIGKKFLDIKGVNDKDKTISLSIHSNNNDMSDMESTDVEKEKLKCRIRDEEEKPWRIVIEANSRMQFTGFEIPKEDCGLSTIRKQLLNAKTALLEYYFDDYQSYIFYISNNKSRFFRLSSQDIIQNKVEEYLNVLKSSESRSRDRVFVSKRLLEVLIPETIRKDLYNKDALIIIPDGILFYVPFEALPSISNKYFSYLVEDLAISYCPSISSLLILKYPQKQKPRTIGLLALGGVTYQIEESKEMDNINKRTPTPIKKQYISNNDYAPIPFSGREVIEIGKLFPGSQRTILTGKGASESALKKLPLNSYRFIHFACHGYLDGNYPVRSSLVLAKDEARNDDGFLRVREIYDLDIKADLVVLSACQTGIGAIERHEGPIGLTRPFFYAGANSVLSSLWQVSDKSTVIFMRNFYQNLFSGHNTTVALQLAKKKMLKSVFSNPFYWASFILNGNPATATNKMK